MTLGAVCVEHRLATLHQTRVGFEWRRWRRHCSQDVLDAVAGVPVDALGVCAVTQSRTDDDLVHRCVESIPVQGCIGANGVACVEGPDRLHLGVADRTIVRKLEHAKLYRIERVDPARAPGWSLVR